MTCALATIAAVVGGIAISLNAQAAAGQSTAPALEAASVKRNNSGSANSMRNLGAGGRMVFENYTLRQLIAAAYDLQSFQLIGGPSWVGADRFDVLAKADTNAPLPQLNLMLQSILAERFKLLVRQEKRELPIYVLVRDRQDGRLGPALKAVAADCGPTGRGTPPPGTAPGAPSPCQAWITPTGVNFAGQTMGRLTTALGQVLRELVVDKTGLAGGYDLQLSFAPPPWLAAAASAAAGAPDVDPNLPSLFTALQEQLGLKLERQQGPVDVVVIESAEQPTAD
jgi:uncharacterized protein (TIGR03435 family)